MADKMREMGLAELHRVLKQRVAGRPAGQVEIVPAVALRDLLDWIDDLRRQLIDAELRHAQLR